MWQQANLSMYILGSVTVPNQEILEYSQSISMSVPFFLWNHVQSLNRWVFAYSYRKEIGFQIKYIFLLSLLFHVKYWASGT